MRTLILVLVLAFNALLLNAQCKVLKPEISANYDGKCKDGLANGEGKAWGTDSYEGVFKKGYPHGKGKYVWANGDSYEGMWKNGVQEGNGTFRFKFEGKDSVQVGMWKKGKYSPVVIKEVEYKVVYKSGITRVSFVKISEEGSQIEYLIQKNGTQDNGVSNLMVDNSSGNNAIQYKGWDNIVFPFEATIRYSTSSAMSSVSTDCEIRFKILKKGSWRVTIGN